MAHSGLALFGRARSGEVAAGALLFLASRRAGVFLQRDGRHKEAAEAFRRAAKLSPGDADAVAAQAQALLSANDVAEAARVAGVAVAMECAPARPNPVSPPFVPRAPPSRPSAWPLCLPGWD